jgi:hypothetical protein
MQKEKPIIIVGTGRCGSTIFHRILSEHPNVAWLSALCNKFPDRVSINKSLMKAIDYPVVGNYLKKYAKPGECYDFWEYYCTGFRAPCRDLTIDDLTINKKEKVKSAMNKMLTHKRNHLLIKITGWPRISFLQGIFGDVKIIHIIRDGRAVANSFVNVKWWHGWKGPQNWRMGELSNHYKEEWEKYERSFIALAGIEWKMLMDAWETTKRVLNNCQILELKYEDICLNPFSILKNAIKFCDLEWSAQFKSSVKKKYRIKNANYKWEKDLSPKQKKVLEEVLGSHLRRYGYLIN